MSATTSVTVDDAIVVIGRGLGDTWASEAGRCPCYGQGRRGVSDSRADRGPGGRPPVPLGGSKQRPCSPPCCCTPTRSSPATGSSTSSGVPHLPTPPDGAPGVRLPAAQGPRPGSDPDATPQLPHPRQRRRARPPSLEQLVAAARAESPSRPPLLREGLGLGVDRLAELGDSFARADRARLEEERLAALEQRIEPARAGRHAGWLRSSRGSCASTGYGSACAAN